MYLKRYPFIYSFIDGVHGCAGAQESLSDKETLKPCEGYDLTRVNTPQDYQAVANSTESLEKIEDCMRSWIKQIEQVSEKLLFFFLSFILSHWQSSSQGESCCPLQVLPIHVSQLIEVGALL